MVSGWRVSWLPGAAGKCDDLGEEGCDADPGQGFRSSGFFPHLHGLDKLLKPKPFSVCVQGTTVDDINPA